MLLNAARTNHLVPLKWTHISIVGHGLSTGLELGHRVGGIHPPVLVPQSFLLQVLPGRLPLDQGHPAHRVETNHRNESEFTPHSMLGV